MTLARSFAVALAVQSLALPAAAQEAPDREADDGQPCELRILAENTIEWDGAYGRGYDVFDDIVSYEPLPVIVEHGGSPCRFFLTATPLTPGASATLSNGGDTLPFDLRQDTNGRSIVSQAFEGTPSTRIEGSFAENQNQRVQLTLSFTVPPAYFAQSGLYSGQVMLRIFREEGTAYTLASEIPVELLVPVPARLIVASSEFSQGSTQASIDLGELSNGATRDIAFDVRSNSDVEITVQSANQGALAHSIADIRIPYRLTISSRTVDLTQSASRLRVDPSRSGATMPFRIEVSPNGYPAGSYRDTLNVIFTAN